jgi:hypothetical protein
MFKEPLTISDLRFSQHKEVNCGILACDAIQSCSYLHFRGMYHLKTRLRSLTIEKTTNNNHLLPPIHSSRKSIVENRLTINQHMKHMITAAWEKQKQHSSIACWLISIQSEKGTSCWYWVERKVYAFLKRRRKHKLPRSFYKTGIKKLVTCWETVIASNRNYKID